MSYILEKELPTLQHKQYLDLENDTKLHLVILASWDLELKYNVPEENEFAALIVDPQDQILTAFWNIAIHQGNGQIQHLSITHPPYMPLQNVLLLPCGHDGWHDNVA